MTKAARIRIGRIRMKNGGADVRVLNSAVVDTECAGRMRRWLARSLANGSRPDAFVAVAFTMDSEYAGGVATVTAWYSGRAELQTELLPILTERAVTRQIAMAAAESVIMGNLGYVRDDEPDPAS